MATRVSDIDASEVAVEVSRTWRSEEAGKEDADWWKWVQRVRDLVRGPVARTFRIATPMIISAAFPHEPLADELICPTSPATVMPRRPPQRQ
jgi:type IV secretory pathway VirB2 component (pilin)